MSSTIQNKDKEGIKYKTSFTRLSIKTHLLTKDDDINEVVKKYCKSLLKGNEIVCVSAKAIACTQNRVISKKNIYPSRLARFLSKHAAKSPNASGLGDPYGMQVAIQRCGCLRILLASAMALLARLFHKQGWFYKIAGSKSLGILAPGEEHIPPYDQCVIVLPLENQRIAREISEAAGCHAAVVSIDKRQCRILGTHPSSTNRGFLQMFLKDDPFGEGAAGTPIVIVRREKLAPKGKVGYEIYLRDEETEILDETIEKQT